MNISMIIKEKLNEDIIAVREKDVETLGLVVSNPGKSFISFIEDIKYVDNIPKELSAVITNKKNAELLVNNSHFDDIGIYISDVPRLSFFKLHNALSKDHSYINEDFETRIGDNCRIDESAHIASKNVIIGNNVIIEEFTSIREGTVIGDNSIIRAGCRICGEGFEFKKDGNETFRVVHLGRVLIGNNVEIQYNTCVDRAIYPWDATVIGDYSKIDNLVHIAHGVKIGKNVMIVANSGIGGRVEVGDSAWIGFGATVRNGIKIGEGSRANMGSVVTKSIPNKCAVSGNFAIDHNKFIDNMRTL